MKIHLVDKYDTRRLHGCIRPKMPVYLRAALGKIGHHSRHRSYPVAEIRQGQFTMVRMRHHHFVGYKIKSESRPSFALEY